MTTLRECPCCGQPGKISSDCGRDYDPASCSIIKYYPNCGAKMDGARVIEVKNDT